MSTSVVPVSAPAGPAERLASQRARRALSALGEGHAPLCIRLPFLARTLSLSLPRGTTAAQVLDALAPLSAQRMRIVTFPAGRAVADSALLAPLGEVSVLAGLPGGKGGFGSMLRAQGGKMSARRRAGEPEDRSACRDLSGRRLSVKRDAERLAAYMQAEPERRKALDARHQARIKRLEKMLGRTPTTAQDVRDAAAKMAASDAALAEAVEFDESEEERGEAPAQAATEAPAKTQIKDHKFVEHSRAASAGARSAAALALAKRKKAQAKAARSATATATATATAEADAPRL